MLNPSWWYSLGWRWNINTHNLQAMMAIGLAIKAILAILNGYNWYERGVMAGKKMQWEFSQIICDHSSVCIMFGLLPQISFYTRIKWHLPLASYASPSAVFYAELFSYFALHSHAGQNCLTARMFFTEMKRWNG